jgi:hypothetical protein
LSCSWTGEVALGLDAFAAPARVVTMVSWRESFENCSADMKTG